MYRDCTLVPLQEAVLEALIEAWQQQQEAQEVVDQAQQVRLFQPTRSLPSKSGPSLTVL